MAVPSSTWVIRRLTKIRRRSARYIEVAISRKRYRCPWLSRPDSRWRYVETLTCSPNAYICIVLSVYQMCDIARVRYRATLPSEQYGQADPATLRNDGHGRCPLRPEIARRRVRQCHDQYQRRHALRPPPDRKIDRGQCVRRTPPPATPANGDLPGRARLPLRPSFCSTF